MTICLSKIQISNFNKKINNTNINFGSKNIPKYDNNSIQEDCYCPSAKTVSKQEPVRFAKHIEFQPATTIKEAIEFAKANLGIKEYGINNFDIANYINQALVNINNKFKGKAVLPNVINWDNNLISDNGEIIGIYSASSEQDKNYFGICKKFFENYDDQLSRALSLSGFLTDAQDNLQCGNSLYTFLLCRDPKNRKVITQIQKYLTNNNSLIFTEKKEIECCLIAMLNFNAGIRQYPANLYKEILSNHEDVIRSYNFPLTIEEFSNLPNEIQERILNSIPPEEYSDIKFLDLHYSPFTQIYHELGHLQRMKSLPKDYLYSIDRIHGGDETVRSLTREFLDNPDKQRIAAMVSDYAQYSPEEFCAEVFAGLMDNRWFSDEVMDLYKSYAGELLP